MTAIDLLQRVGLTKYEAEAYYTLLREGALTGYEVGKRSAIPLPRSYDVVERLSQKGLALVQPGDPPRYRAEEPARFLEQIRSEVTATLEALGRDLTALPVSAGDDEFWVLRGRGPILARARAMVREAQRSVHLGLPASRADDLEDLVALVEAQGDGDRSVSVAPLPVSHALLVLVDGQEALVGTLGPGDRCQAVISGNRALLHLLDIHPMGRRSAEPAAPGAAAEPSGESWVAWDTDKQRRLLNLHTRRDVA